MLHLGGVPDSSSVRDSQAFREIDLLAVSAAAGFQWSLIPAQRSAQAKVALAVTAASDTITSAQAQALVKGENGQLSAADVLIAAQLDGATSASGDALIVVGGLRGLGEVAQVSLRLADDDGVVGLVSVEGPVTPRLSGAGALGAVAAGSLIWFQEAGVLVACVTAPVAPAFAAGLKAAVKVIVKL
jgi:hypothetical protein